MSADRHQPFSELDQALRSRDLERMARLAERGRTYFPRGAFLDCETGTVLMPGPASASDPVFGASGPGHAAGDAPDPGGTAGTTRFLREDATWQVPSGGGTYGLDAAQALGGSPPGQSISAGTTTTLSWTNGSVSNAMVSAHSAILAISGSSLQIQVAGVYLIGGFVWWNGVSPAAPSDHLSAEIVTGNLGQFTFSAADAPAINSGGWLNGANPQVYWQALPTTVFLSCTAGQNVTVNVNHDFSASLEVIPYLSFVRLQ